MKNFLKSFTYFILINLFISTAFASWPPETGAKVQGNGLEYPTKLDSINQSLQSLLDNGSEIISSYIANDGPVVTLKKVFKNKHTKYFICIVKGAGSGEDQNITTSKCFSFN